MPQCFAPLEIRKRQGGKVFVDLKPQIVRCGRCIGCRMQHSENWATRITHEASLHEANCFVTLTYAETPDPPTVSRRVMQLWIKRVRKSLEPARIRYFLCGEYSPAPALRPHYHAILFGVDFRNDRTPWKRTPAGHVLYRSPSLEATWPHGFALIGDVTQQSAGYVARYSLKKSQAWNGQNNYERLNAETGEFYKVNPEFIQMSTSPGIGYTWADTYRRDLFPSGFVIVDGQKKPVPKAYTRRITEMNGGEKPSDVQKYQEQQRLRGFATAADNTPERLLVKNELHHLRAKQLKRSDPE